MSIIRGLHEHAKDQKCCSRPEITALERRQKKTAAIRASKNNVPRTPPTIAPVLVEEDEEELVGAEEPVGAGCAEEEFGGIW